MQARVSRTSPAVSIPHWSDLSRASVAAAMRQLLAVSIPHWSDLSAALSALSTLSRRGFNPTLVRFERSASAAPQTSIATVSIPHWSDLSRAQLDAACRSAAVSIPHWSDLSASYAQSHAAADVGFNPTLVRFEPAPARQRASSQRWFQSHIGPI